MKPQHYYDQPVGWKTARHIRTERYPYFEPPAISEVITFDYRHGYSVVTTIETFDAYHIVVVAMTEAETLAYIKSLGGTTDAAEEEQP